MSRYFPQVISTVDTTREQYEELLKRGQKLVKCNNVAPFLQALLDNLAVIWKEAHDKSQARLEMLNSK